MTPVEFLILRDTFAEEAGGAEGFTLGRIYCDHSYLGYTLEDQDRRLEEDGTEKIYGKTAMPIGRYRLELYDSPKHGLVPLFKDVPQFEFTEIHGANNASQLLGCVAVGVHRTAVGVAECKPVVERIVGILQKAEAEGREVWCEIARA